MYLKPVSQTDPTFNIEARILTALWFWCRTGPFEVSADLEESMEFVEPEAAGPAEESGDEAVTDEETDLGTDWETVPSPRFCDIPSQVGTPGEVK